MAVSAISSISLNITYKYKITKERTISKVQVWLNMTQITVLHIHQSFKVTCCLHFGRFVFPKDSRIRINYRQWLKSHMK
jgi:hypothetical protein